MKRVACLVVIVSICFISPMAVRAEDPGLVQTLVGALGVTETQAAGGAAAILGLAKGNLGADDYLSLVQAVPEVGDLLGGGSTISTAATAATAVSAALDQAGAEEPEEGAEGEGAAETSLTSDKSSDEASSASAASALTAAASALGDSEGGSQLSTAAGLAGLAGSFSDLGLDADMVQKFVPVILQYVGGRGGDSTSALLKTALGVL